MKKTITLLLFLFAYSTFAQNIDVTQLELSFGGSSSPQKFTKGLTKIYFAADDGVHGNELWVYDTITNTTHLVKDLWSGNSGLNNSLLITIGDIVYFTVNMPGAQLWRSDGTEAGTYLVKLLNGGGFSNSTVRQLFNFNGNIVFDVDDNVNGSELWISNGTTAGTTLVKDIRPGSLGSSPTDFFVFNNSLFFVAENGTTGRELWKSDGTNSGTMLLKDINGTGTNSLYVTNFLVLNNSFYFFANDGINGYELWKSDGTSIGTQLFKDITVGSAGSYSGLIGAVTSDYFIFEVTSSLGTELWKCDGTDAGTVLLKDIYPGPNSSVSGNTQFAVLNNKIYFNAATDDGLELWSTDGTNSGTQLVKDIQTGAASSNIYKLTAVSNYLIFSAKGDAHSYNTVWKSDGTTVGTFELKDTNLTFLSNTDLSFVEFDNRVFFAAGYNSENGIELWTTNGTIANTNLFKDIAHGSSGGPDGFNDVVQLNGKLIFTGAGPYPYVSDGTVNGTYRLSTTVNVSSSTSENYRPGSYTKAGNIVFFKGRTTANGYELWKTDGTPANTVLVKDIKSGNGSSLNDYTFFMEYNGIFYFKADDGIHGEELWRSDGTDAGTYMVKDIYLGSNSGLTNQQTNVYYNHPISTNDHCYAVVNGFLYIIAYDGIDHSIWRTDGTESGTIKAVTITSTGAYDWRPSIVRGTSDKIFFVTNANNSSYGNNTLWSTDGTQTGTINLGMSFSTGTDQFRKNAVINNIIYFTIYHPGSTSNVYALVKSNGTTAGTVIVKDNLTQLDFLEVCNSDVYFVADGSQSLWRSNGTTVGTLQLGNLTGIIPGQFFKNCNCFQNNFLFTRTTNQDRIYFVNNNSTSVNNYLTTNVTTLPTTVPFSNTGIHTVQGLYGSDFGLFYNGISELGGYELYFTNYSFTLGTNQVSVEPVKSTIVIYPNPANNLLNIKAPNDERIVEVTIYDLLGKEVYASNDDNVLNVSGLNNGIYLVRVSTTSSNYSSKMVIKR